MLVSIARFTAIGIFTLCSTASVVGAEIFRWEDAKGELHLVSDLNEVPPQYREAALAASKKSGPGDGSVNFINDADGPKAPAMATPSSNDEPADAAAAPAGREMPGPSGEVNVDEYDGDERYDDPAARARARARNAERRAAGGDDALQRREVEEAEHPIQPRPGAPAPGEPLPSHRRGHR